MKPQDILFWVAMVMMVGAIIMQLNNADRKFTREMLDAGYCQDIRSWTKCK